MCCGEIEIAQGYVLERASFKISSTRYKYYSNNNRYKFLLQKLYESRNTAKLLFRGIVKSYVDISFQ